MAQEKVLEILRRLGFQPELIDENFGYRFEYEGLNFLLEHEDEDTKTISLIIPAVFDVTEENRSQVIEAAIKLSTKLKFVQPNLTLDSIWLNYQHYLGDNEPTEDLIEHMVRLLAISTLHFQQILNNEENDE